MPSHIIHPIPPVFDTDSRILILGSFPSVKSRESCFFYGHPQNRFWKLLARLRKEDIPSSVEEKKAFLLRNHIAVWDTIHSCSIEGSSDSSIRDVFQTTSPLFWITLPSRRFTQTAGCLEKCTTASAVNRLALRQSNCHPPALPMPPGTSTG